MQKENDVHSDKSGTNNYFHHRNMSSSSKKDASTSMPDEEYKSGLYSQRSVQHILNMMVNTPEQLRPTFDAHYGCRYPEIEYVSELNPQEILNVLEKMSSAGILDSHFYEKITVCISCNSPNIGTKYLCSYCKSMSIEKHKTIEHVPCGFISIDDSYFPSNKANNSVDYILCPRCEIRLRPSSPEVKISEGWFVCKDCSRRTREPNISFYCRECQRVMQSYDVAFKDLRSYTLNRNIDKTKIILIEPLKDGLRSLGYRTESPGFIVGKSGIKHRFDIVCYPSSSKVSGIDNKMFLTIDVVYSDIIVDESHLIKLFAASYDVRSNQSIMVAVPEVTDSVLKLAREYGIIVIRGKEMQRVSTELEKQVISTFSLPDNNKRCAI